MTQEAQRMAMAEACGWKRKESKQGLLCIIPGLTVIYWQPPSSVAWLGTPPPDYPNDLNATQAAVLSKGDVFIQQFNTQLLKKAQTEGRFLCELKSADWVDCFIICLGDKKPPTITLEGNRGDEGIR